MEKPIFIGICGGSGSGKTYLLEVLKNRLELSCSVCSLDDYYKLKEEQSIDENGVINFDLPSALDTDKLKSDIESLSLNQPIEQKEYHFNVDKGYNVKTIQPADVIIIEGLFVLEYDFLKPYIDYSIYVQVDRKVQLERRLKRDLEERGYSQEEIMYQWNNHVLPCYDKYLKPHKSDADFIFDNNLDFESEMSKLLDSLESRLHIFS